MAPQRFFFEPLNIGEVFRVTSGQPPSWRKLYAFATLCHLAYSTDQALIDQFGAWAGYQQGGLVRTPGTLIPNFIVGKDLSGCVICITGTNDWKQLMGQGGMSSMTVNPLLGPARIAAGFSALLSLLKPHIETALTGFPPPTKLTFCGHSLGGALAQLLAVHYRLNTDYQVKNCVTFGSPSVGDSAFVDLVKLVNLYQLVNFGDIVPELPPHMNLPFTRVGKINTFFYDYKKPTIPWVLEDNPRGLFRQESTLFESLTVQLGSIWTELSVKNWRTELLGRLDLHRMATYTQRLRSLTARADRNPDLVTLDNINNKLEQTGNDPQDYTVDPPAGWVAPDYQYFIDPDNQWNNLNQPPPSGSFAPGDVIEYRYVENIESAGGGVMTAAQTGGVSLPHDVNPINPESPIPAPNARPNWEVRGKDRNILLKFLNTLMSIDNRDRKSIEAAETAALSTREQIFPWDDDEIQNALSTVRSRLQDLLNLTKG